MATSTSVQGRKERRKEQGKKEQKNKGKKGPKKRGEKQERKGKTTREEKQRRSRKKGWKKTRRDRRETCTRQTRDAKAGFLFFFFLLVLVNFFDLICIGRKLLRSRNPHTSLFLSSFKKFLDSVHQPTLCSFFLLLLSHSFSVSVSAFSSFSLSLEILRSYAQRREDPMHHQSTYCSAVSIFFEERGERKRKKGGKRKRDQSKRKESRKKKMQALLHILVYSFSLPFLPFPFPFHLPLLSSSLLSLFLSFSNFV